MECNEFKRAAGAEPRRLSATAQEHLAQCVTCEQYARHMLSLDDLLKRALQLPVGKVPVLNSPPQRRTGNRWLPLAASLLLSLVVAGGGWLALPRMTLAGELIEHVSAEQDMVATAKQVSSAELDAILLRSGVRLNRNPQHRIWYALNCPFRGNDTPHLIVETAQGRVTVLLLGRERVRSVQTFDEQGYRGTILPSGPGSIAIIATNQAAVAEAAKHVAAAVQWIH